MFSRYFFAYALVKVLGNRFRPVQVNSRWPSPLDRYFPFIHNNGPTFIGPLITCLLRSTLCRYHLFNSLLLFTTMTKCASRSCLTVS